jgi:hypothetical protein
LLENRQDADPKSNGTGDRDLTLQSFVNLLTSHPEAGLFFMLPDGDFVPEHFHVTEVGRVQKEFIDCGGTVRSSVTCVLQVWVANDTDHRLQAGKLAKIVQLAESILKGYDLPVEVEYESGHISQYPITAAEVTPGGLLFHLDGKHTECLAPDQCGVGGAKCG